MINYNNKNEERVKGFYAYEMRDLRLYEITAYNVLKQVLRYQCKYENTCVSE